MRFRVRRSDGLYRRPWSFQVAEVHRLGDWPSSIDLPAMWTKEPAEAGTYDDDSARALVRDLGKGTRLAVTFATEPA